jgi:hypothetical protein
VGPHLYIRSGAAAPNGRCYEFQIFRTVTWLSAIMSKPPTSLAAVIVVVIVMKLCMLCQETNEIRSTIGGYGKC